MSKSTGPRPGATGVPLRTERLGIVAPDALVVVGSDNQHRHLQAARQHLALNLNVCPRPPTTPDGDYATVLVKVCSLAITSPLYRRVGVDRSASESDSRRTFVENAGNDRNGREHAQGLLDHHLYIVQLVQVLKAVRTRTHTSCAPMSVSVCTCGRRREPRTHVGRSRVPSTRSISACIFFWTSGYWLTR
jgi:hypothetical protein